MINSKHFPFITSIFGGILVWFLIFILFPAKIVSPFANESFWFIFLSYLFLILGYIIFPTPKTENKGFSIISKKVLYVIILTTLISYLVRYVDLFLYRNVSFKYDVWENRRLLAAPKTNLIFIICAIFSQLYFMPIIFVLKNKIKSKKLIIISLLLFLLPFVEGYIRASRNSFFIPTVLLFIILMYFGRIRFTGKHILIICSVFSFLFLTATSIIMQRESSDSDANHSSFTTDFFLNEFLEPSPEVFKVIYSTKNPNLKKLMVSGFQIAQYYVHGVFEFDNLVKYYQKKPLKKQYGKFTFFILNKFTNKYGFTNINQDEVQATHPRILTFITFFGGLYIDFGWLGLIVIFLYGCLQKIVSINVFSGNSSYLPLFFFLLFCNFFMLTFNFLKGLGTYILVVCFAFILSLSLCNKLFIKNK